MDTKAVVNNAVPTPFGWVMAGQENFDINCVLAFTKQMASLARGLGTSARVEQEAPVLVHVRA